MNEINVKEFEIRKTLIIRTGRRKKSVSGGKKESKIKITINLGNWNSISTSVVKETVKM